MKLTSFVALTLTTSLGLAACKDDDGNSDGGASGSSSSGGAESSTGGADGTETGAEESSTGGATAGMDESSGSSSGGPTEVYLGGEAVALPPDPENPVIVGAEIYVYEDLNITAVTDEEGLFNLGPLPPDSDVNLIVAPMPGATEDDPSYLGAVIPERTGTEDRDDVQVSQLSQETVDQQQLLLAEQGATPPDLTSAIIIARVINTSALMEGDVTLTMDPPPVENTYYTPTEDFGLTLNSQIIVNDNLPVVVYYNLAPSDEAGAVTLTAEHPTRTCTVDHPNFPLLAGHMTLVEISCVAN